MTDRYVGYPATIEAVHYQQMENFRIRPQVEQAIITPAGAVDRAHIGVGRANPMIEWATKDLVTVFANVDLLVGLACPNGATFRLQQRKDGAVFHAGLKHVTHVSNQGHMCPGRFGASEDDVNGASISLSYYPLSDDGLTDPIATTPLVDFAAAPAPAFVSRFFLGPVYHNAVQLNNIRSWSCDPGHNYQAKTFDLPFPTKGAIVKRDPVFEFTIADMAEGNAVSMWGSAITGNLDFYLRKGIASGPRVADNVAQHIQVRVAAGDWDVQEHTAQEWEDGSVTFRATPTGTVSIDPTATIPQV